MAASVFEFLAAQSFITLFVVLGLGHLLGRLKIGFFSPGSTAGALLVALLVGSLAFEIAGVRFAVPDLGSVTHVARTKSVRLVADYNADPRHERV